MIYLYSYGEEFSFFSNPNPFINVNINEHPPGFEKKVYISDLNNQAVPFIPVNNENVMTFFKSFAQAQLPPIEDIEEESFFNFKELDILLELENPVLWKDPDRKIKRYRRFKR